MAVVPAAAVPGLTVERWSMAHAAARVLQQEEGACGYL